MVIGIIGAGASGMAAALAASESENTQVILMERQARVGRKLGATGNGRCNLSNLHAAQGGYHGEEISFASYAIDQFGPEKTLAWFSSLGLYTVAESSGRVYPYSDQANSVVDVLRFSLERPNITVKLGFEAERVKRVNANHPSVACGDSSAQGHHGPQRGANGFFVESKEEKIYCDKLIIACGGLAGTKLGGTMSGYKLLRSMGHKCTRLRPALVQIRTGWHGVGALKGVRANCHAAIYRGETLHRESTGEIQFTEFGLSGPVMFEISRDACQGAGDWRCLLDFLPELDMDTLNAMLRMRRENHLPASELFTGILHNRLGRVVTQTAGISANALISQLSDYEIGCAADLAKHFSVTLTEPLGMDSAQVTAGGILTREFECTTMESKLVPGLYACGEVLDIDGDCGGYNLQWAWSSGRLAGLQAAEADL